MSQCTVSCHLLKIRELRTSDEELPQSIFWHRQLYLTTLSPAVFKPLGSPGRKASHMITSVMSQ